MYMDKLCRKNKKDRINKTFGFTLIETMIAMTIFMVVIIVGMGAVLNAMNQHAISQNSRTVMDNLNFIMEDMSRNIRLGTNFHCVLSNPATEVTSAPQDCPDGSHEIIFNGVSGATITYTITVPPDGSPSQITKQIGSGVVQVFNLPEVTINTLKSGFIVDGSLPPKLGDTNQPVINIGLSGTTTYQGINSTFSIQTTVASRPLDG